MIFIGGIHGAGKSHLCSKIRDNLGYHTFSASKLISEQKEIEFSKNKFVSNIEDNQQYLLSALNDINDKHKDYIIEGHFCLLNSKGDVTRIEKEIFFSIKPSAIVLLTEKPEIIADRLKNRDNTDNEIFKIQTFQNDEVAYAIEIAKILDIPYVISNGVDDLNIALEFISTLIRKE